MLNKTINSQNLSKELEILREAINVAENKKKNLIKSPIIKKIIDILETFLKSKKLVCYGGTAINNILPESDQFYDKSIDIPDYDFFSPNALDDAKELADIYYKKGFDEVEAKAGVHIGTYKVFVNFIPIADITQMTPGIYDNLKKTTIVKKGIHYAPPDYLRMSAYLELSRPDGDVSRWEKVYKRLLLLNKNYPIDEKKCTVKEFIGKFNKKIPQQNSINSIVLNIIINQKLVIFGAYALYNYSNAKESEKKILLKAPNFDVLAEEPLKITNLIKESLTKNNIGNITIIKNEAQGEIIPEHYEIKVGNKSIIYIYKPLACHSYNTIKINNNKLNIASIDTMLSLYLSFIYMDNPIYDTRRILCICQFLIYIQSKNKFNKKGIFKRFTSKCHGEQDTIFSIRAKKATLYNRLKDNVCDPEYEKYFLRYIPLQGSKCKNKKTKKEDTKKNKKDTKKKKKDTKKN